MISWVCQEMIPFRHIFPRLRTMSAIIDLCMIFLQGIYLHLCLVSGMVEAVIQTLEYRFAKSRFFYLVQRHLIRYKHVSCHTLEKSPSCCFQFFNVTLHENVLWTIEWSPGHLAHLTSITAENCLLQNVYTLRKSHHLKPCKHVMSTFVVR